MKRNRIISLVLSMLMLLVLAPATGLAEDQSGNDPFGAYEEPITLTVGLEVDPNEEWPEGDSPSDNQYTRYIEEQLNVIVDVVWTASSSDYDQKVNLAISSNSLPDLLVVNDTQFNQMVKSDQLADLTEAFANYASPTMMKMLESSKNLAIQNVTFNDKMYALTSVSDGDWEMVWIRKDWMDALGLEAPKTLADLKAIAKAFVEQDPGGNGEGRTIGFAGPENGGALYSTFLTSGTNLYGFDPLFSAFRSYPGWWVNDEDGNVVYGSITAETRAALEELADWYAQGLIDPEMGIRQNAAEPIINGRAGIFSGGWWMGYAALPDVIANNSDANFQCYTIPINEDSGVYEPRASSASYMYAVIRKGYEHPEVLIKLNNLLIRDESTFDTSKGGIGNYPGRIAMGMLDESSVTVQALRDVLAGNKTISDFSEEDFSFYKLLRNDLETIKTVKLEPVTDMDISAWNPQANISAWSRCYSLMVGWAPLMDNEIMPVYSQTYSTTPTVERRWANLKKLEDETFMKIIMNQEPIESFDQFVQDWKAQGGDTITAEVQEFVNSK